MDKKSIAQRLKELRGDRSMKEVADACKIAKSTLAMYESGRRIPKDEIKVRIACFFKVSVETLFF